MSHKLSKRARQQAALAPQASASQQAIPIPGFGSMMGNGHQAADNSRLRGYVYFPELDTRKEITAYSRTEIMRRARFLYANKGIARRVINGLSRMIAGTGLVYQAATTDKEWNKLAEAYVESVMRSRHAYDLGGRYNGYSSQQATLRFRFRDGDCAQVLVRNPDTGAPCFAFYEAHQIGDSGLFSSSDTANGWRDGVLPGPHNQALGYRILGDDGAYSDLDAGSVLFQCDYERGGQSRGLSALSHASNNMLDDTEITTYIKMGVKLSNRHGYWIETAAGSTAPNATAGGRAGATPQVKINTPDGPINVDRVLGGGEIPELGTGQSIKFNTAANPHPNQLSLLEHLIRDAAWGLPFGGMAPELLWNITGLGGANTRFVMADAQNFIELGQQALVDDKLQPEVEFILACGMESRALRRCQDPQFWKARWITPARITVDFGRDGKLYLDQIKSGALTFSRLHGWSGYDSEPEMDRWLDEMAYWKKGAEARGLDSKEVLSSIYGRPGQAPAKEDPANTGDDAGGENASQAEAQLQALLKKPGAAEALLRQLQSHRD